MGGKRGGEGGVNVDDFARKYCYAHPAADMARVTQAKTHSAGTALSSVGVAVRWSQCIAGVGGCRGMELRRRLWLIGKACAG